MKTAISVPDHLFELASRCAAELGISRSEFFARAARQYLDQLDAQSTTREINAALAHLETGDHSAEDAVRVGRRLLAEIDDEW